MASSTGGGATDVFDSARLRIAHLKLGDPRDLESAVRRAVAISGTSLGVERVGVWVLSEDRRHLMPLHVQGRPEEHGRYMDLPLHAWPRYAAALDERRVIAADDARTDVRTRELADDYLAPRRITSMVDAPIFIGGEVWGIVCHEHEGPARTWQTHEIDFAVSVADMLSALFEHAARLTVERELRQRDAATSRQRKNEALVHMSAGIAHDFGNVLQTISLLAERSARIDPTEETELIVDECARGQVMVAQLLDFARSTPRPPAPVDLGELVRALHGGLDILLGMHVTLEATLVSNVLVAGNRGQLERVITNLVVNARDAMPRGGTVSITLVDDEDDAVLSVRDTGTGIAEELREHLFEPFFTTRTASGGTGLGLATVALIVEQHGGRVSVDSSAEGATFTVRLPRLRDLDFPT